MADRHKLLLSGGSMCTTLDVQESSRVGHVALVDLSSGTSVAVSDKPTHTVLHAAVYHGGKVYAIVGVLGGGGFPTTGTVDIYDVETDTWSTASASYPLAVASIACTVHDSKIVCTGGYDGSFYSAAYMMDVDASALSWSALPSLSSGRILHGLVAANGFVYAIAGYYMHYGYTSKVEVLNMSDPTSWSATSVDIPDYRLAAMYTSANGKLYVISGVTSDTRKIDRSYLTADAAATITSWKSFSVDLGDRECSGCCCDGRLNSGDMAYVSESSGVTALAPASTSSIDLRTIVCP